MLHTILTALNKAEGFVATSISKLKGISRPLGKFFTWLFGQWLMLPVRYNVLNLSRYGGYSEKAIHEQLKEKLPFVALFHELFAPLRQKECIAAFDASFVHKSGTKTYGLGKFWNGSESRVLQGLEAGCLAIIDVEDRTAYALEVVQTPPAPHNHIQHYASVISERLNDIRPYTRYLAVDGNFMKKSFVLPMLDQGLQIITKGRSDSELLYLCPDVQPQGRGRRRKYGDRIEWKNIDLNRWHHCYEDAQLQAYELAVWSVCLGRPVKAVYLWLKQEQLYFILICTDTTLAGAVVLQYYRLRFQIEFLIRDAKSYTGMEHCQSRHKVKLYNHFNMSLYSVSVVKFLVWAKEAEKQKRPFSMRSLKTYFTNKFLTLIIFAKLDLDPKNPKIRRLFEDCLNIGAMAA